MRKLLRTQMCIFWSLALTWAISFSSAASAAIITTPPTIVPPTIITRPDIPITIVQPKQPTTDNNVSQITLPDWVIDGLKQPVTSKAFEKAFFERDRLLAVAPPQMTVMSLPYKYDLSQYVTFTGSQDGWGGCILRSIIHTIEIENEKKCAYSPDPSFWYVHQRQEAQANGGAVNTVNTLSTYGVCPEASCPSNYDNCTPLSGGGWSLTSMPAPTAANDQEAAYYKVFLSDPYTVDINTMKQYLKQYGPLLFGGWMYIIQGANPKEGHCVTCVGWDDSKQAFKLLNSWGDHWNGDGYIWLNYNDVATNLWDWRYIETKASDRTGTKYAYSARVNIVGDGSALRNQLKVKIGVVGKDAWVFWDHLNQTACYDDSQNLCIDIPLPDYAASYRPPSDNNIWYIQVTNDNGDPVHLEKFAVAKQKSATTVDSYSYSSSGSSVVPGNSKQTFAIPHLVKLNLTSPKNMHNGWLAGSTQNITWTTTPAGSGSVRLYYSTDSGSTWTPITSSNISNSGTYPWQVPNLNITTARILIEYVLDGVVMGQDNSGDFTIGTTSSLFKAPTNLSAKAYGKQIVLNWSDNNKLEGTKYVIERKSADESFSVIATVPQCSSYTDKDTYPKNAGNLIITKKSYTYRVRAENGSQFSSYSNEAGATADFMAKVLPPIDTKPPLTTKIIEVPHELPIPNPEPGFDITPGLETPGF
ncbi:MAG: C1 family peptidase [Syntrophomonas sp.]